MIAFFIDSKCQRKRDLNGAHDGLETASERVSMCGCNLEKIYHPAPGLQLVDLQHSYVSY